MKAWIFIMAPIVYKMPRIMDTSAVAKVAPLRKPIQKVSPISDMFMTALTISATIPSTK